jgi:hypothetical protein
MVDCVFFTNHQVTATSSTYQASWAGENKDEKRMEGQTVDKRKKKKREREGEKERRREEKRQ